MVLSGFGLPLAFAFLHHWKTSREVRASAFPESIPKEQIERHFLGFSFLFLTLFLQYDGKRSQTRTA